MSQGLGSVLSPKGKLVHTRLRLKYAQPRKTAYEPQTDAPKRHNPRPSMPDLHRSEVPLQTSASERAIHRKPHPIPLQLSPKNSNLSTLAAEKTALDREIAELQQILRHFRRSEKREMTENVELERKLEESTKSASEIRREVDFYHRLFQKLYKNVLHESDFSDDFHVLKLGMERSSSLHVRQTNPGSRLQVVLNELLKRSFVTLAGWKKVGEIR